MLKTATHMHPPSTPTSQAPQQTNHSKPHLLEDAAAEVDDGVDATELLEHKQQAAHDHALAVGGTQQALTAA